MTDPVMQPLPAMTEIGTSVPPQILLGNHLKAPAADLRARV